ncbi:MAG TPA: sigma-54 dependent transcriptional regulator, partial [Clostridia bacterium]|nr:sigma-54 dependent transcriptional regulator [Clostridia bacterium]
MKPSILIIDDEPGICQVLTYALNSQYQVFVETDAVQGMAKIEEEPIDLVLLDLQIGTQNGIEVLKKIKAKNSEISVIMMTAYGSIRSSVEAMKNGAFTYLTKPLDIEELQIFIQNALKFRTLNEQVTHLNNELRTLNSVYGRIVGQNAQMQRLYAMIERLKDIDTSVTITGESGCGKELVARAIHYMGRRGKEKFVAINCSAIPDSLFEEELFGHKKGSFTGAIGSRRGKLDLANQGTLFLDEIGDMSPAIQSKLLRVLQEREYSPLGDNEVYKIDVRVLAATNKNLTEMMKNGAFRSDLFYRLNVVELRIPPLRERKDDIPMLCEHLIKQFNKEKDRKIRRIDAAVMQLLIDYDYPGNVRELGNILEYASVVSDGETISLSDLPPWLRDRRSLELTPASNTELDRSLAGITLAELERRAVQVAWIMYKGKQKTIARSLGLSERGLRNKLYQYNLISK